MGKAATAQIAEYPFAVLFSRQVPDLTPPDSDGWSTGTCPYCHLRGAFRANLNTGKWACLPPAGYGRTVEER